MSFRCRAPGGAVGHADAPSVTGLRDDNVTSAWTPYVSPVGGVMIVSHLRPDIGPGGTGVVVQNALHHHGRLHCHVQGAADVVLRQALQLLRRRDLLAGVPRVVNHGGAERRQSLEQQRLVRLVRGHERGPEKVGAVLLQVHGYLPLFHVHLCQDRTIHLALEPPLVGLHPAEG
eukprot:129330-Prorocentrum_minimum.AAC.3